MEVSRQVNISNCNRQWNRSLYQPWEDPLNLPLITDLLDSALRTWDRDRAASRSQIAVAASMLRDALTTAKEEVSPCHVGGLAAWQARKVTRFIDASIESKIRLRDCATQTRLSAAYFSVAFKRTFGITAAHYIRCRRIEHAQRLMLLTPMPLAQVALATGFSNQAHYSRVFRTVTGSTPNIWRRRNVTLQPPNQNMRQ